MTKIFNPQLELSRPAHIPTPYQQKDGYRADGRPRTPKWKIKSPHQGVVAANDYVWWYHFGPAPQNMYTMFLDTSAPLDTSKSNIILVTKREMKNLVHMNNHLYVRGDKGLQRLSFMIAKSRIALNDLEKEVNEDE